MISIFKEIISEKKIKVNIENYINIYYKIYLENKKKYSKIEDYHNYIYQEYTTIKNIEK